MKETVCLFLTTALLITISFVLIVLFTTNNETVAPATNETPCEHEFVVTSEYVWWLNSYKTYSKCYKCGLEV